MKQAFSQIILRSLIFERLPGHTPADRVKYGSRDSLEGNLAI